jgi:hypothetical protein
VRRTNNKKMMIKSRRTSAFDAMGSSAIIILGCSSSSSRLPAQNVLKTPRNTKTQRYRQAKSTVEKSKPARPLLSSTVAIFLQPLTVAAP